jgi:hypothetical protein
VHAARFLFEGSASKSDFYVLKFDFKNAFNCVSRQAFLDQVAARFPSLFPFVSLCYGSLQRCCSEIVELLWRAAG